MNQPYPPQQPYYPPQPPPKKRRVWLWVLLGVIGAFILMFAACAAMVGGAAKSIDTAGKTAHHVTYQVETSGPAATVSYDTSSPGGASNSTATGVASGWSIDVDHYGILGPNMTATLVPDFTKAKQPNATVTCKILSGGKVVKQASASGEFASVTCMANLQELGN